jgi:nicotinamidase-related amidase
VTSESAYDLYVGTSGAVDPTAAQPGLVVVDMVYASAHGDYGWARMYRDMGMQDVYDYYLRRLTTAVIPNIQSLLSAFRSQGLPVIYTTVASERDDFSDLTPRMRNQIRQWTDQGLQHPYRRVWEEDAGVLAELAPQPGDHIVNKTRFSAFNGSNINDLLQRLGLNLLVFTGVGTNYCVQCTLMDAYDLGYECLLVEDATATLTQEVQDIAIRSMEPYAQVAATRDLLAQIPDWQPAAAGLRS